MKLRLAARAELGRRRRTLHLLVDIMARVVEVDMDNVVDMENVVLTNTRILLMIGSSKAGTCKGRTLTENINFQGSPGQVLCIRI